MLALRLVFSWPTWFSEASPAELQNSNSRFAVRSWYTPTVTLSFLLDQVGPRDADIAAGRFQNALTVVDAELGRHWIL